MFLREDEARKELVDLRNDMELARSVYVNSRLLFRAGTRLTDERIATLKQWQIQDVIVRKVETSGTD